MNTQRQAELHQELGAVLMKFIDRLSDHCKQDPAAVIADQLVEAVSPILEAAFTNPQPTSDIFDEINEEHGDHAEHFFIEPGLRLMGGDHVDAGVMIECDGQIHPLFLSVEELLALAYQAQDSKAEYAAVRSPTI